MTSRSTIYGPVAWVTALFVAMVTLAIGVGIHSLPETSKGLTEPVDEAVSRAGVTNKVTAVLLNFRAFDTLLEVTVLVTAVLGVLLMTSAPITFGSAHREVRNAVLTSFTHVVSPLIVVTAGYLLWVGSHAPGGAFQAGALLAGLGVLLSLCGISPPSWYSETYQRMAVMVGLTAFVAAGGVTVAMGRLFLEYPVAHAKSFIVAIETASTVSIGAILYALFVSAMPEANPLDDPDEKDGAR